MAEETGRRRVHERWAHLRFSVIGQLLAAPPDKGELKAAIEALAARIWRHPTTGEPVRFGFSTIERWYYRALNERSDPVRVLRRKLRANAGRQHAIEPAYRLAERGEEHRWLVTGLWSEQAVGIVGGEPKCCKSFLALDLAVSVASGTPCLRRFVVPKAGRVLLYAAEDALHIVRHRLDGIASAAGVALADLDIQVITVPVLRLDLAADRRNLAETVDRLRPRLLILDPFVRLHRIDENASGEVAPLLAYLRELQRRYGVAVLVVHHAKKGGAGVRAGQALRGSSEFHAWGDSNLYLRRDCDELSLTVEHRAAPSPRPLIVELAQQGLALALEVVEREKPVAAAAPSLDERITTVLAEAQEALPFADLRAKCRVRAATLHQRIGLLATAGRIVKTADGYRLTER